MTNISEEIKRAREVLYQGGVILYPTDTIWGIGCDATNEQAVAKVYAIKQRAESKALLCLVDSIQRLQNYVEDFPDIAWDLIDCSDKPLTIIYEKGRNLASNLLGSDGSIGIRITQERFSHGLCEAVRKPIVSTSANIAGAPSPKCFADIDPAIIAAVDYVVDFRREEKENPKASSIIKLGTYGEIEIIRP